MAWRLESRWEKAMRERGRQKAKRRFRKRAGCSRGEGGADGSWWRREEGKAQLTFGEVTRHRAGIK